MDPKRYAGGVCTAIAIVLVGLACTECSARDALGRHQGDDGRPFEASVGGLGADAGAGGGSSGRLSRDAGGVSAGGRDSAQPGVGGASADSGAARVPPADAGGKTTTEPISRADFQTQMVHALCDNVQNCCTAAQRGYDAVHCRQTVIQQYVVPLSDTSVSLHYDPVRAAACIEAVTQAARACKSPDVTTCFDAFIGTLTPGTPCQSSFECASGPGGYGICGHDGVCVQPRRGVLGDACMFSCVEAGATSNCRTVFLGAAAEVQAACHSADGLVCVTSANGSAKCQPSAADCKQNPDGSCPAGQLCDPIASTCYVPVPIAGSCATRPCGNDGYCMNGTCLALKTTAAMCMNDAECQSHKCEKSFCVVYSKAAADWCGEITP